MGIPLALGSWFVTRNLAIKNGMERIYYPIEPIFNGIRKHHSVTPQTPKGISEIKDIDISVQSQETNAEENMTEEEKARHIKHKESLIKAQVQREVARELIQEDEK
jgi:hypothetical protein